VKACVVDASVAIKWYVPEVHSEPAAAWLARMSTGALVCHVPDLFCVEFGNILWKKVRIGEFTSSDASEILEAMFRLPKRVHPTQALLAPALSFACATGRTVYDSIYVALALGLQCELVTADERLWNALKDTQWGTSVRWIEAV
jgi:predicted nucleic acid-binding protein